MSTSELILKVEFEGDLRRFRIQKSPDVVRCWETIREVVRAGFGLGHDFLLKYRDEEGDECTLVSATLPDCMAQSGTGVLRLYGCRGTGAELPSTPMMADNICGGPPGICLPGGGPEPDVATPTGRRDEQSQPSSSQFGGCRGIGPWKLLMCFGSLRAAGMMNASMIASMMLQFLPILAQRAHRKQEKLNRIGGEYREMLLPTLHSVFRHLHDIDGAGAFHSSLEAFICGSDTTKLGDTLAVMLKVLSTAHPRVAVARLLKSAGEELVDLLPRVFPDSFNASCPRIVEHIGIQCACCGSNPLLGPRFHCLSDGIDLCGDCFIDAAFETPSKFECRLNVGTTDFADGSFFDDGIPPELVRAFVDAGSKWKDIASQWASAWKGVKGKGKGKCFGKERAPDVAGVPRDVPPWSNWQHWMPDPQVAASFWAAQHQQRCQEQWPPRSFGCNDGLNNYWHSP